MFSQIIPYPCHQKVAFKLTRFGLYMAYGLVTVNL
jgi:hypothetical protein